MVENRRIAVGISMLSIIVPEISYTQRMLVVDLRSEITLLLLLLLLHDKTQNTFCSLDAINIMLRCVK